MDIKRPISNQPIPDNAKLVFKGQIFDTYQWPQPLYDGRVVTFEKLKRPDTVVIFPVLDNGKIILLNQEQPGKKPFISACGGRIDEGEDILDAAKRELLEETGYEAEKFTLWKASHPTTKVDWVIYCFIAKGCKKAQKKNLDGGEKIKLKPVTFDDFLQLSRRKTFMEKEIIQDLYEALLDKNKYIKLKELFKIK